MRRNSLIRLIFMQAAQTNKPGESQTWNGIQPPTSAGALIEVAAHLILIDQAAPVGTIHMNKRNNRITQVPRKVGSISDASGPPTAGAGVFQTDQPRQEARGRCDYKATQRGVTQVSPVASERNSVKLVVLSRSSPNGLF